MSEEYSITLRQSETAWIMDLVGDITIAAQGTLDQVYAAIVAALGQTLVINFKAVDYITSNGLAIVGSVVFRAGVPGGHDASPDQAVSHDGVGELCRGV